MVQITYTLRLDMRDTGIVNTSLRLKQGDSGMKIAVNVFNGGVSAFDSSTTPKIVFRRPDGASVMADMTVESSLYSYTLVGNELQVPGKELIDIKFPIGEEGRESTMSCSIEVVPDTITPNTHGSGIYDNDLAELVEEATEAAETVQEVVGDSEAWANGERNGVPVGPEDPTYHNNSKYWSEQANPTRLENLTDVDLENLTDGDILRYSSEDSEWQNSDALSVAEGAIAQNASDISDLDSEFHDIWKNEGAYNHCPILNTTQVINGVTWTVNSDGTVTANCSSNNHAKSIFWIWADSTLRLSFPYTVRVCGAPSGAASNTYHIGGAGIPGGELYTETNITANTNIGLALVVAENAVVDNIVFKPMITTDLNATYADYQPYAMTNGELTTDKLNVTAYEVTIQSGATATKAFKLGEHIYRDGKVCNLMGDVGNGDTWVKGTNYTEDGLSVLTSGYDLDNLYITGHYYCGASAIAQSLLHKPSEVSQGFEMRVINAGIKDGKGQAIQATTQIIEMVNTMTPCLFIRHKGYNMSWGSWYKFTGTAVQ